MKKFIDVMKIALMSVIIGLALVFSYNISMALFIFVCLIIVFLVVVVIKSIYSIKASGKNEYQILYETVNNMWKDKDSEKCLKIMRKSKINHDSISYKSDLALIHYCNGDADEAKKLLFELDVIIWSLNMLKALLELDLICVLLNQVYLQTNMNIKKHMKTLRHLYKNIKVL